MLEDLIVTDYLNPVDPFRVPAALEALAGGGAVDLREPPGLDGALLLGTDARPGRARLGRTPKGRPGSTPG